MSGAARLSVTRLENRPPRFRVVKGSVSKPKLALGALLTVFVMYQLVTQQVRSHDIVALLAQTCLVVHLSSSYAPGKSVSMRAVTLGMCVGIRIRL